jgi:hypothetical protein
MQEGIAAVVASKPVRQNMRAYRTFTNNPGPHINAELLLVSRMDYTMRIRLFPLVLVVNIDAAVSTETGLICKEH